MFALVSLAHAGLFAVVPRPFAGHAVFEMRAGVDTSILGAGSTPTPTICAELTPLDRLSVEACGNGSGVLHEADAPDMMHLRLRYAPLVVRRGGAEAALVVGAGMAEVQRTADAPGFRFGPADSPDQIEAAGGELSVGVKGRWWPHERAFVALEVGGGAAYIPGAPTAIGAAGPIVAFAGATIGAGF